MVGIFSATRGNVAGGALVTQSKAKHYKNFKPLVKIKSHQRIIDMLK